MDLPKHNLPILQEEGIGLDNNNTRLSRKSLSLYPTVVATDMISANIHRTTSSNRTIPPRMDLKVIIIIISLLPIKLLQRGP
jgi:hypothetical protein